MLKEEEKGALVAFRPGAKPQVIFAPNARQSIDSVGIGRDKIYVVITDNVIGAVHVFTPNGSGWNDKVLSLPGQGSADIAAANDYGPEAMFSFQNYLTPTTLYFDGGNDQPADQTDVGQERTTFVGLALRVGLTPKHMSAKASRHHAECESRRRQAR